MEAGLLIRDLPRESEAARGVSSFIEQLASVLWNPLLRADCVMDFAVLFLSCPSPSQI